MKLIAAAIIEVMKEVKGMEKNSNVGTGKSSYNGTKDQDVKEVFNEALSKYGLSMMPIDIEESTQVDRWQEVDQWSKETPKAMKQKQSVFTKVKVKYMLLHISGESITIAGYGHGIDAQDKGAGKATTYAMKNALLYTFLTPVGKIDDSETTHSDDIPTPIKETKPIELTHDQYIKAIASNSKGITATLNAFSKPGYSMNTEYRIKLTAKLKELKELGSDYDATEVDIY